MSIPQPSAAIAHCGTTAKCGYLYYGTAQGRNTLPNDNTAQCGTPAQCGHLFPSFILVDHVPVQFIYLYV